MSPYNEEEYLRRITADIISLEKRIQRQLSDIERSQPDGLDMATAMKRLFVLDEYRAVLLEDRRLVIQRMNLGALSSTPTPAFNRSESVRPNSGL